MSALLLPEFLKRQVLETRDLGLQKPQVHDGSAPVVVALDLVHRGAFDVEDGHASAVDAPDLDLDEIAAADEPEGAQEEVLGLKHLVPPPGGGLLSQAETSTGCFARLLEERGNFG
jgi:hypothetical protein